jgi:hypothetical protein
VHQSFISSVPTTLYSALLTLHLVVALDPKPLLVLTNGPSNAVPLIALYRLLSACAILPTRPRIVYIESWCRVTTLSLTGQILSLQIFQRLLKKLPLVGNSASSALSGCMLVDRFIAHWEGLRDEDGKIEVIENLLT